MSHTNLYSEVGLATFTHLVNVDNAPASVLALMTDTFQTGGGLPPGFCEIVNFDIEVLDPSTDSDTWVWGLWVPSLWSFSIVQSLPAVMVHEFGHGIGFVHVTDPLSVMERRMASEIGGQFRISENDYVGLQAVKPGASTGKNFMISKWDSPDTSNRVQRERWDGFGDTWEVRAGGTLLIDSDDDEDFGPGAVAVMVNGTSTYSNVPVYWSMSSDDTCFDGDDIIIGTRNPTLSSSTPYVVGPSSGLYSIPSGTALGTYKVCAGIDPYGTLSETDTTDNVIISERKIEVIP